MMVIPSSEELAPLVAQATGEMTHEQYTDKFLSSVVDVLKADPRQYRAYGPFWWPLKAELNRRGIDAFGEHADMDICLAMKDLNPVEIACAAYATKVVALDDGRLYSADHLVENTDGEIETYSVIDEEMERLIAGNA